jgi:hypothetical protein
MNIFASKKILWVIPPTLIGVALSVYVMAYETTQSFVCDADIEVLNISNDFMDLGTEVLPKVTPIKIISGPIFSSKLWGTKQVIFEYVPALSESDFYSKSVEEQKSFVYYKISDSTLEISNIDRGIDKFYTFNMDTDSGSFQENYTTKYKKGTLNYSRQGICKKYK